MKVVVLGAFATVLLLGGCATSEKSVESALKKNPKILFEVIEENPEQFLDVVNRAARKAQEGQKQKQIAEIKIQQEKQLNEPLKPVLSEKRMLYGSAKAKNVIVEYADFQCPACRMAYKSLKEIKEKYKDDVQIYYKNMPLNFHKMAYPAALYFEAVLKQDVVKARKFYEHIFDNQNQLRDEGFLKVAVQKVGADAKKVAKDIASQEIQEIVAADMREFEKFEFRGTPVVLVNGVALPGAQPSSEIERVIRLTQNK